MMKKLWSLFALLFVFCSQLQAQNRLPESVSSQASFYLITCGPGPEIYSQFGHSAIRIHDPGHPQGELDVTFNYGMFQSDDPDFVWKFTKRTAQYYLDVTSTSYFVDLYTKGFHRSVYQQKINLTPEQVALAYETLRVNFEDVEQRFYLYEFFFDNCATRPRDIIELAVPELNATNWARHEDADQFTFRDFIDGGFSSSPWTDFGIDLVLGSRIDRDVTNHELMFYPKYLMEIAAKTEINGKPLAEPAEDIGGIPLSWKTPEPTQVAPELIWWIIALAMIGLSMIRPRKWILILDTLFFTIFGALGIFLLFMWLGTDHMATKANYNLIWATPIHLFSILVLFIRPLRQKLHWYFGGVALLLFTFILIFWLLPQEFHPAAKPIVLMLVMRYFKLHQAIKHKVLFR